jgi:hypothetical protein
VPDIRALLDAFQRQLEATNGWPPPGERRMRADLEIYRALRESDRDVLRRHVGWEADRKYVVDPLAERIPGAFADLIYGEAPEFTAANEADQDHLDEMVEANGLVDELQAGVGISCGEGSAWWRILADRSCPYPTIEWHSRLSVVPSFSGRQIRAVAFVEELERPPFDNEDDCKSVWRYVELQVRGATRNLLYRAEDRNDGLGRQQELSRHYFTEDLEPEWNHGLDLLLAGYIPNVSGAGKARILGRSDFHGVKDLLLELNEAASIGSENMKLTAKKRIVVPQKYLTADGEFPAGVDVILASEADDDPDKPDKGLIQLEWSFDAGPLIEWIEHTEEKALTRARVAPQLVGRNTEGAQTGPAFRARLLDSLLAAGGKARPWDTGVPQLLRAAQMVDELPLERGGFGHGWAAAAEAPAAERASALPVDEGEEANRITTERGAEILSRRTGIEERHPDWSEDRVLDELKRIDEDAPAPAADPFAPPPPSGL